MTKLRFSAAMAVVCAVLSFSITWQYRTVSKIRAADKTVSQNSELMLKNYKSVVDKNEELRRQVETLSAENDKYRKQDLGDGEFAKVLKDELKKIEMDAGLIDVTGPGVVVTLSEKEMNFSNMVENPNAFIVHDADLLETINELKSAGAEAISLSGERVVARSEVRCVGPVITVNRAQKSAPFEIKAIGDPATLENALNMFGGVVDQKCSFIKITIKKVDNMTIEKLKTSARYNFATPKEQENA
jgi:uncharacterized protein YlxW (UPF0749 family)